MKMASNIDYSMVDIPRGKPPENYTYAERRAEILQLILKAGHPGLVSRTELSHRYGTSIQQITKDIQVLTEGVREWMGRDAELVTNAVYRKAIDGHLKSSNLKDHAKAAELLAKWNEQLFHFGIRKKTPESIEHLGGIVNVSFEGIKTYPSTEELDDKPNEPDGS